MARLKGRWRAVGRLPQLFMYAHDMPRISQNICICFAASTILSLGSVLTWCRLTCSFQGKQQTHWTIGMHLNSGLQVQVPSSQIYEYRASYFA